MSRNQVICLICNKPMRADNLPRHQKVCAVKNKYETILPRDPKNIEYQKEGNDLQFVDDIINNNIDRDKNDTIQQSSMDNLEEYQERNPAKILFIHDTGNKLSSEENKDESMIDTEKSENKIKIDDEKEKDIVDIIHVQQKDNLNENNVDRFGNKSKGLSNFDIIKIAQHLKIPNFRGTYMLDELPKAPKYKESGIVNFNTSHEPGSHWVSFFKDGDKRIYFDSYGQIIPTEIKRYLKTAEEYETDKPVIQRNIDIVQESNTKICGHLCLYVLDNLSKGKNFQEIINSIW